VSEMGWAREQLDRDLIDLEKALTPESLFERVTSAAKSVYVDKSGGVNMKNVAITAGVLVAFIAIRKIF
jgi:nicotinate-nucleotide pyrophosphorylase